MYIETDLHIISQQEKDREVENWDFKNFLKQNFNADIDPIVHKLNTEVSSKIDCTSCGNCCKTLMINVTEAGCETMSTHLQTSIIAFKQKYIETSQEATTMVINSMPCSFLSNNKCTVYEQRFEECREFPHLHKPDFVQRTFGTLMHYGRCPIIYNVWEQLKQQLHYTYNHKLQE